MKAKIYYDPFTKKSFNQEAEILDVTTVPKKLNNKSNFSEISTFDLYSKYGLKKALVKYSDGTIDDNVFFDPNDIIPESE